MEGALRVTQTNFFSNFFAKSVSIAQVNILTYTRHIPKVKVASSLKEICLLEKLLLKVSAS